MMRIGPHIQDASQLSAEGWRWCSESLIVKAIDYPAPLMLARPGAITIFRAFVPDAEKDSWTPRDFLDLTLHRLQGFRPTYIESQNEWRAKGEELRSRLPWESEFTRLAHSAGYKMAGFCFPTGNPEAEDWFMLRDAGFCGVDAVALHEYWGDQGLTGWNALRYRKAHGWLNGKHPPFVVTECGRDAVEGCEGRPGWKLQDITGQAYALELATYDAEISKDAYVLGATVFTIGPNEQRWREFDLQDIIEYLPASTPNGGEKMWDRHIEFDSYQKVFGGQGANPNDAFGRLRTANPGVNYGVLIGSYRGVTDASSPFITAWTTTGIFWYRKATGTDGFATREEDLPLS